MTTDPKTFDLRPALRYALLKSLPPLLLGVPLSWGAMLLAVAGVADYGLLLAAVWVGCGVAAGYRLLLIRATRYQVSRSQIKMRRGLLHQVTDYTELYRVKDFRVRRSLWFRLLGLMHVTLYTSDVSNRVLQLRGLRHSNLPDVLRDLVEEARTRKRVYEID